MSSPSSGVFRYETDVFVYKAKCQWIIRNWRLAVKDGSNSYLDSPPFHAPALADVQWHIRLWPNRRYGAAQPPQMDVAIFVNPPDAVHSTDMLCCLHDATNADKDAPPLGSIRRTDYWGLSSRIHAKPEELTCRDLMIECTIQHSLKSSTSRQNLAQMDTTEMVMRQRSAKEELMETEQRSLAHDMQRLLGDENFADVTLCLSSGHKFQAHRAILANRSPVFRAMFTAELVEQHSTTVTLNEEPEVDELVWSDFMTFLYTGTSPELDTHCLSLLKLADKYEMPGLKSLSSISIAEQLQVQSVPHALVLAFLHRAPELRDAAHRFVRKAGRDVYSTEAWRRLMTEWPDVAMDALTAVSPPSLDREIMKIEKKDKIDEDD